MARPSQKPPAKKPVESRIPHFCTIQEEAEFWDTHSSTEFEDEFEDVDEEMHFVVIRGRPTHKITVRLPERAAEALSKEAEKLGIPASRLAMHWILERLSKRPGSHIV